MKIGEIDDHNIGALSASGRPIFYFFQMKRARIWCCHHKRLLS